MDDFTLLFVRSVPFGSFVFASVLIESYQVIVSATLPCAVVDCFEVVYANIYRLFHFFEAGMDS